MTISVNNAALDHARQLIKNARIARDTREDWSQHAPDTGQENAYIDKHGYAEYGKWHLGVDSEKSDDTKGRYSFPFGDYRRLHRCAILAIETMGRTSMPTQRRRRSRYALLGSVVARRRKSWSTT